MMYNGSGPLGALGSGYNSGVSNMAMDIPTKVGYLKTVDIFVDLSDEELEALDNSITMIPCEVGRIFYAPEDTGEALFILRKGRVQLYRVSRDGRKLVIATLGPGTVFGEMSSVGQEMYDTFAEAIEDCAVWKMNRSDLERLLLANPRVAIRILEVLGKRLLEVESRLEDIAFKTVAGRLASLLLRLAKEQGATIVGFTHQNLADAIGTYRETVTQTLNQFKAQGLVSTGRKRIGILDPEGLRLIAEK